jgi:hypothetical protein
MSALPMGVYCRFINLFCSHFDSILDIRESTFDSYLLNVILIPELYMEIFSVYLISVKLKRGALLFTEFVSLIFYLPIVNDA